MPSVRASARIAAPPERVWALLVAPDRFPEWQSGVIEVRNVSGPVDELGARYTLIQQVAGRRFESHWEVTEATEPSALTVTGTIGGVGEATGRNRLEPADGSTQLTLDLEYSIGGGLLGGLVESLFGGLDEAIGGEIRRSGERLKALVEREAGTAAAGT